MLWKVEFAVSPSAAF